jgi:hypothetical protein
MSQGVTWHEGSATFVITGGKPMSDRLTLRQASEYLNIPVNTLRWYRTCGTGPRSYSLGDSRSITSGPAALAARLPDELKRFDRHADLDDFRARRAAVAEWLCSKVGALPPEI